MVSGEKRPHPSHAGTAVPFLQWVAILVPLVVLFCFGVLRADYISSDFIYKQFSPQEVPLDSKRWLACFLATVLLLGAAVVGFNCWVDPFGVFSHKSLEWPSYEMTINPLHRQNHLSERPSPGL